VVSFGKGRVSPDGDEDRIADGSGAGFELVDHTAETTLRVWAPTFVGLVDQATRGFLSLVPRDSRGDLGEGWRDFEVDEGDRTATLVAWLNALVFRGDAESWLPVEASVEEVGEAEVRIRCKALELRRPFVLVKAATLHGAEIRSVEGGLEVEVTLDI